MRSDSELLLYLNNQIQIFYAFIHIQGEIIKFDIGMVSRINNCNYVGNRNNLNLS